MAISTTPADLNETFRCLLCDKMIDFDFNSDTFLQATKIADLNMGLLAFPQAAVARLITSDNVQFVAREIATNYLIDSFSKVDSLPKCTNCLDKRQELCSKTLNFTENQCKTTGQAIQPVVDYSLLEIKNKSHEEQGSSYMSNQLDDIKNITK